MLVLLFFHLIVGPLEIEAKGRYAHLTPLKGLEKTEMVVEILKFFKKHLVES